MRLKKVNPLMGVMLFNSLDDSVGKSLDLYGESSRDEMELLKQIIRPGDTVVDVGAFYGSMTVFFSRIVGSKGTVYAFEPQRVVHQILCANVALNELANVHCLRQALGATEGIGAIKDVDYTSEGCHSCATVDETGVDGETVPITTVDELNLQKVRLIKVILF